MDEVSRKTTDFIRKISQLSEADVLDQDTKILSLGYIDSFNVLTIISFIEEEFKIKIDADNITLEQFDSIESISQMIRDIQKNG